MNEPAYEVVWPLGKWVYSSLDSRPGLTDLSGKTICELSDFMFRYDEVFPTIRELLRKRYSSVKFVEYSTFGDLFGGKLEEKIATLPDVLRKHGCDAVISGIGG
ncbi:hypothetical protein ACFLT4_07850 [Chloroflexota bacterium]